MKSLKIKHSPIPKILEVHKRLKVYCTCGVITELNPRDAKIPLHLQRCPSCNQKALRVLPLDEAERQNLFNELYENGFNTKGEK